VAVNWQALWAAYVTHTHAGIGIPWRSAPVAGAAQPGMIVLWNGSVGSIPAGWALCNGANGTPDMRNRFIRGAGGGYGEGGAGGVDTHNFWHGHGVPVSVGAAGNHYHSTSATGYPTGSEVWATDTNHGGGIGWHTHGAVTTSWAGDHGHGVTGASAGGNLGAVENRPPFYTLAYIMKL
jgi:hypothetical protein